MASLHCKHCGFYGALHGYGTLRDSRNTCSAKHCCGGPHTAMCASMPLSRNCNMEAKAKVLGLRHFTDNIWNRWSRPGTGVDVLGAGLIICDVTPCSPFCHVRRQTQQTPPQPTSFRNATRRCEIGQNDVNRSPQANPIPDFARPLAQRYDCLHWTNYLTRNMRQLMSARVLLC